MEIHDEHVKLRSTLVAEHAAWVNAELSRLDAIPDDPEQRAEMQHYFDIQVSSNEKESEFREWSCMAVSLPSEALIREQKLEVLRGELAELHRQSNAPFTQTAKSTLAPGHQAAPSDAPVVKEKVDERRARWLDMFEAEEKRESRGALQRVADSEGVDRSNMSKDIAKARAARDELNRSGMWDSQLVQDGKRKR